jgi:hypothetical protein
MPSQEIWRSPCLLVLLPLILMFSRGLAPILLPILNRNQSLFPHKIQNPAFP